MTLEGNRRRPVPPARLGGSRFAQLGGDLHASDYTSYCRALGRKRRRDQADTKVGPNAHVSQDFGNPFCIAGIVWPGRPQQFRTNATTEPFTSPAIGLGACGNAEYNRRRFRDKARRDTGRCPGDHPDE